MCTRYSFTVDKPAIEQHFGIGIESNLKKNDSVSPMDGAYVVPNQKPLQLKYMTWGLIPHWSNDGANTGKLINARAEGIGTSTSFRLPIRSKRCLVLADSFFVWKKEGLRQWAYRVAAPDQPLLVMVGVWDSWNDSVQSFSIITTPAIAPVTDLTDRMPLILNGLPLQKRWLSVLTYGEVMDIVQNPDMGILSYRPVSQKAHSEETENLFLQEEKK